MRIPKAVHTWGLLALILALLVLPLVVVLVSLRKVEWASLFDLALIEIRVREVGGRHTPLLGIPGRLGKDHLGHHPGPLAFYALSPLYHLFGGTVLALRASFVALGAAAMAIGLVIAQRQAGRRGLVAVGLVFAMLDLGFGLTVLTQFWNPHLPIPWFVTFLLAVWATVEGKPMHLPLAAGCASLSAQAHVAYLGACSGPALLAAGATVLQLARARRTGAPSDAGRALVITAAVLLVLWLPPIVEEWRHTPGNLATLFDYFRHPPTAPLGWAAGARLVLRHLDPVHLLVTPFVTPGMLASFLHAPYPSDALGWITLGSWVASAGTALLLRSRRLLVVHGVAAVTLVTCWVATSRIVGGAYPYLVYPAWTAGASLLLSIFLTAGCAIERRRAPSPRVSGGLAAVSSLIVAATAVRLVTTLDGPVIADLEPARQLAALATRTAAALEARRGEATGKAGRYLVTWQDALHGGGQGIGLVNELTRRGYAVGIVPPNTILFGDHWAMSEETATARLHFANAGWIAERQRSPGSVMAAFSDLRSKEEVAEYHRLHQVVVKALKARKKDDRAERLPFDLRAAGDGAPYGTPEGTALRRMIQIGVPAAVFVEPVNPTR